MENNIQINLESISKNAKEIFHRLRWKGHIYCPQCSSIRIATDKQSHRCKDCDFRFSNSKKQKSLDLTYPQNHKTTSLT